MEILRSLWREHSHTTCSSRLAVLHDEVKIAASADLVVAFVYLVLCGLGGIPVSGAVWLGCGHAASVAECLGDRGHQADEQASS